MYKKEKQAPFCGNHLPSRNPLCSVLESTEFRPDCTFKSTSPFSAANGSKLSDLVLKESADIMKAIREAPLSVLMTKGLYVKICFWLLRNELAHDCLFQTLHEAIPSVH